MGEAEADREWTLEHAIDCQEWQRHALSAEHLHPPTSELGMLQHGAAGPLPGTVIGGRRCRQIGAEPVRALLRCKLAIVSNGAALRAQHLRVLHRPSLRITEN